MEDSQFHQHAWLKFWDYVLSNKLLYHNCKIQYLSSHKDSISILYNRQTCQINVAGAPARENYVRWLPSKEDSSNNEPKSLEKRLKIYGCTIGRGIIRHVDTQQEKFYTKVKI